uniref:Ovule protein n=1 Tax=Mesocestoides corti TaxID=53468 RepID=A0A5K3FWJ0_MESCO
MNSKSSILSNVDGRLVCYIHFQFPRLSSKENPSRRKFTPNISKALAKKSQSDNPKPSSKPRRSQDSSEEPKPKRGRINRKSLDGENSRFVQSYSIFEMGVGCVVKTDNHSVELQSSSGRSVKKVLNDEAPSTSAVALPTAPCPRPEPFVTDVSQFFSFPPTFMPPDSPTRSPGDPSSPVKNGPVSKAKSCASVIPSQLFDGTSSTGSLFTLRIPEVFLSEVGLSTTLLQLGLFCQTRMKPSFSYLLST